VVPRGCCCSSHAACSGERALARVEGGADRGVDLARELGADILVGELREAPGLQQRGLDPRPRDGGPEVGARPGQVRREAGAQLDDGGRARGERGVIADDVGVEVDRVAVRHRVGVEHVEVDEVEQHAPDLLRQDVALERLLRRQPGLGLERRAVLLELRDQPRERVGRPIRQHAVVVVMAEPHRPRGLEGEQVAGDAAHQGIEPRGGVPGPRGRGPRRRRARSEHDQAQPSRHRRSIRPCAPRRRAARRRCGGRRRVAVTSRRPARTARRA